MRVGTSTYPFCYLKVHKDHPHACGDKRVCYKGMHNILGSSPCVWGQVLIILKNNVASGIIPMRVGTSATDISRQSAS